MESGIKVSEQETEIKFDLDALRKVTEKELKKAQEILEFVTKYKFDGPCEIQLSYKSAPRFLGRSRRRKVLPVHRGAETVRTGSNKE